MNKILTKQHSRDIIFEKFGVDMNNLPNGLELPREFEPYLDEKTKEAWDMGWRGKLRYFSSGSKEELNNLHKEQKQRAIELKQLGFNVNDRGLLIVKN